MAEGSYSLKALSGGPNRCSFTGAPWSGPVVRDLARLLATLPGYSRYRLVAGCGDIHVKGQSITWLNVLAARGVVPFADTVDAYLELVSNLCQ